MPWCRERAYLDKGIKPRRPEEQRRILQQFTTLTQQFQHSNKLLLSSSINYYTRMCRRRHVRNVYNKCGHAVNLPEEEVPCENEHCKFSPFHPKVCANCTKTCWQYHQYPEQYSPQIDSFCPSCQATGLR
ncbi:hypothetical protein EV361DRAFT_552289 [Lentinula raphanica]|nr:hypothetical protein F5880DRAFT_395065 [Lentinula raphanica]KAJ3966661.1 hypothetical protein EV361DRAFT_552289 [Lentinula raphanica]